MPTTLQLRRGVAAVSVLAADDLTRALAGVESTDLAFEALNDVLPGLVDAYGAAAASYAADWYDDLRDERNVRGRFVSIPADIPDPGVSTLIGWAQAEATSLEAMGTLIQGGTQRRIANFARQTVTGSSVADPQARGWKRVGDGSSCAFCSMLLRRGAVYTEATADFHAHDHCGCSAEPAWR